MQSPAEPGQPVAVPIERITKFVRQVAHDVRNGLNAIDLQATLITELTTDPEIAAETRKLRGMVSTIAVSLQQLAAHFSTPSPNVITFPAKEVPGAIYDRVAKAFPAETRAVNCTCNLADQNCAIDFELLVSAMCEVFKNAFQFREADAPVQFTARCTPQNFVLEVSEKKETVPSPPERWGVEPLLSTRRGGLGLGLFHARQYLAAQDGRLEQEFTGGQLTTRVFLPLATDG